MSKELMMFFLIMFIIFFTTGSIILNYLFSKIKKFKENLPPDPDGYRIYTVPIKKIKMLIVLIVVFTVLTTGCLTVLFVN